MVRRVLLGAALWAVPSFGAAACAEIECEVAPPYQVGDILPQGRYYVLVGSDYYGLPPSDGAWRYYRVGERVLRVRPGTMEVLGDATAEANAAF